MIEWIVGGVVLFEALFGSKDKSPTAASSSLGTFDRDAWVRKREAEVADWRASWEHEIDRSKWIPQSAAYRIFEAYPVPDSGSAFSMPALRSSRLRDLLNEFAAYNLAHLKTQKVKLKAFLDTVEKDALTDEQADACICLDDAVQIVAAAGSGKTSTMVGKVGYLLHEQLAKPNEILLLAFNVSAAAELRGRIRNRLKQFGNTDDITIRTFHSFGSDVISEVTKKKPNVATWLGSGAQEIEMVVEIVEKLRTELPSFGLDWDLFRTVYGRDIGSQNDAALPHDDEKGIYRTANGEWVKSREEQLIANWLFYHGVEYQYERDYEHDTRTSTRRQYRPDFYYPAADLYHEHFALNGWGQPPPGFGDYLDGVNWKRNCHDEHGTKLIQTTSHGLRTSDGLNDLRKLLNQHEIETCYDASRQHKGDPPITTSQLAGLVRTFQQHVKGGSQTVEDLKVRLNRLSYRNINLDRALRFLAIYEPIAEEWERRLEATSSIDFDDMVIQAAKHIQRGEYPKSYTMIFADEFQDSSRAQVQLLKALLDQTNQQGHLCVVGDDWQSINGFAGADPTVMTEFAKTFPHSSQLKLGTTFRCPASLCRVSSKFIGANPGQLEKEVKTTNTQLGPCIAVFACDTTQAADKLLRSHLEALQQKLSSEGLDKQLTVMLLGRYNRDKPVWLDDRRQNFGTQMSVEFKTVHKAKGLEADYVMILNMVEDQHGFPSQIADDPLLQLAMPDIDEFPMAEERRVFYVALTRAKQQVQIYTTNANPSRFLVEMAKQGMIEICRADGSQLLPCPRCTGGSLARLSGPYGPFDGCNSCNFKRKVKVTEAVIQTPTKRVRVRVPMAAGSTCPTCQKGQMVERAKARYGPMVGCSMYPQCETTAPILNSSAGKRS